MCGAFICLMAPDKKLLGNVDKVFSAFFAIGWTFCRVRPPMQKIISFNSIILGAVCVCVCAANVIRLHWLRAMEMENYAACLFAENVCHRARCDKSGLAVLYYKALRTELKWEIPKCRHIAIFHTRSHALRANRANGRWARAARLNRIHIHNTRIQPI